jgi:lipid-A-disaccharide synthase
MKYYLIAGEASGDLHGSNLMKSIKKSDPEAEFRFQGGDLMVAQGGTLIKHYKDMAFMGLDAVIHLRAVFRQMKKCKADILSWKPDVVILIDYAGFNLPIAEFAHNNKIKTFYYITPKVWAWQESRVKKLKKHLDKLFVIFPFEVDYFKKFGIEAEYFGNPLVDAIHEYNSKKGSLDDFVAKNSLNVKPIIALIPGSRVGEISRLLPEMLTAIDGLDGYEFVIAGAPSISKDLYEKVCNDRKIKIVYGQTYDLMSNAKAAIVTSGTATLETAMLKCPEVVVFKTSPITYRIGMLIVNIKFFSLVNIILDRLVVKELLQFNLARDSREELDRILHNDTYRSTMLADFDKIEKLMGEPGVSDRVAARMVELIK